ncbi:MAG: hypothetical protein R3178_04635 [Rhodothermales bacterium]|nr:hypothetical protein [Rhodothermales bacterium]
MHFIFDKLTSTLVGGVVVLMLITIQARIQSNTVESTIMYTAKKQTLSFAEVLERDLANAGYLSVPGDEGILDHSNQTIDGRSLTTQFEFWGSDAAGARTRIRYRLAPSSRARIDDVDTQLYELLREEYQSGVWVPNGASMSTLTEFRVDLLDSGNNGVVNHLDARKLRIRFENAVVSQRMIDGDGSDRGLHLQSLRWGITLAPRGLAMQAYQG